MHTTRCRVIVLLILNLLASSAFAEPGVTTISHGLTIHSELKYPPDFSHFDYSNPQAPKGGTLRVAEIGTYDTLNPFILKGVSASGLTGIAGGGVFETLMIRSYDEPSSSYGLIAESVELPADQRWVIFKLRKEARFQDGSPITPEDVVFSFEILISKGHPGLRAYYASVKQAEAVDDRRVKFTFTEGDNHELAFIIGQLPILSKADWAGKDFDKTTLTVPLGSGPYKVAEFEPGRYITYQRIKNYWGADLPVNRGRDNFDVIRVDYYRDSTVSLQAFLAGEYDFRSENSAKQWATAYDVPALKEGLIKKEAIPHKLPAGMQAFVFNTRREIFSDERVRQALGYAFDFEWSNKTLFNDAYTRSSSYFANSEMAASGLPSEAELAILEPYRGRIPDSVFKTPYTPPKTDGSGNIRDHLRKALELLREAGWQIDPKTRKLVNAKSGQPMKFEILLVSPSFERIVLPFVENLKRLGVEASVRTVDTSQYKNRLDQFDFDMIVNVFGQSLSPGNEQRNYWHSSKADTPGSENYIGIKDPVIDELVELVISAPDRQNLVTRIKALDRVLLSHYFVIPNWHINVFRIVYWDMFSHPHIMPEYGLDLGNWWVDPEKMEKLQAARGNN